MYNHQSGLYAGNRLRVWLMKNQRWHRKLFELIQIYPNIVTSRISLDVGTHRGGTDGGGDKHPMGGDWRVIRNKSGFKMLKRGYL